MDELRIAVISAQGRGAYLAQAYDQHPRCRVVAIADRNPEAFQNGRERLEGIAYQPYGDVAEMIGKESPDWLFVASPDRTHHALTLLGLRAGCHVYVEKPMCQTITQADEICRAAEEAGRQVTVGLELRYAVPVVKLREMLRGGAIGKLITGYCVDSVGRGFTYFRRDYRKREFSGGLLLQKGVHSIDLINDFVDSEPSRVYATGGKDFFGQDERYAGRFCRDCDERETCPYAFAADQPAMERGEHAKDHCVWDPAADVEDNTLVLTDYHNGARVSYHEIHFTPDYKREFTFIGSEGRVSLVMGQTEDENGVIHLHRLHEEPEVIRAAPGGGGHYGADDLMRDAVIEAALRGEGARPNARDGRGSVAIAAGAVASIDTGAPVSIPALAEVVAARGRT